MSVSDSLTVIVGYLFILFVISLVLALPVMLLWDWLMPILFGLPPITWLQAWGLMLLCSFLFKSHSTKKD